MSDFEGFLPKRTALAVVGESTAVGLGALGIHEGLLAALPKSPATLLTSAAVGGYALTRLLRNEGPISRDRKARRTARLATKPAKEVSRGRIMAGLAAGVAIGSAGLIGGLHYVMDNPKAEITPGVTREIALGTAIITGMFAGAGAIAGTGTNALVRRRQNRRQE